MGDDDDDDDAVPEQSPRYILFHLIFPEAWRDLFFHMKNRLHEVKVTELVSGRAMFGVCSLIPQLMYNIMTWQTLLCRRDIAFAI